MRWPRIHAGGLVRTSQGFLRSLLLDAHDRGSTLAGPRRESAAGAALHPQSAARHLAVCPDGAACPDDAATLKLKPAARARVCDENALGHECGWSSKMSAARLGQRCHVAGCSKGPKANGTAVQALGFHLVSCPMPRRSCAARPPTQVGESRRNETLWQACSPLDTLEHRTERHGFLVIPVGPPKNVCGELRRAIVPASLPPRAY